MIQMNILERIRGFSFNPSKEFAAAKEDTITDAFKYYVLLLAILALILAIVVAVAVTAMVSKLGLSELTLIPGLPGLGKIAPLLGAGAFVGIIAVGIIAALYIAVWLHIWVYLFGGRRGLKQTTKAITYGATPCLILGWVPGPNIIIAPIWSLLLVITGVMELHELSPGMAILAVILAILVPVIIAVIIAAAIVPTIL
ncbi:MAG: YIP1 family protein [Methanophagales archaeon]|nr:YIP1 family protein [Methanophagales archaeon]